PVHVEAVANVVGRSELMATVFSALAVYAALARQHVGWSAAALAFGLLSKENAAVAPALVVWAWILGVDRPDRRRMIALVVGWVGVAFLPVANLLYPAGFYVAERTLYLPSVGLVLAATAALARLPRERLRLAVATLCLLGGVRTAMRVPKWRDDNTVTQSILEDSPDSYGGPVRMAGVYLDRKEPAKALAAARIAAGIMPRDPWVYAI